MRSVLKVAGRGLSHSLNTGGFEKEKGALPVSQVSDWTAGWKVGPFTKTKEGWRMILENHEKLNFGHVNFKIHVNHLSCKIFRWLGIWV